MHVVILGGSEIGSGIANWLIDANHEIAVVEKNEGRCREIDKVLGSVSVKGNGTDVKILSSAGTNRADFFLATTHSDAVNIVACQIAKHHFGVEQTIAIANHHQNAVLFDLLGIDSVIDANQTIIRSIKSNFSSENLNYLTTIPGNRQKGMVSIMVSPDSNLVGQYLNNIKLPRDIIVPLIISREGGVKIPTEKTRIRAGDEIVSVVTVKQEEELKRTFFGRPLE